jgi:hypothetical protein
MKNNPTINDGTGSAAETTRAPQSSAAPLPNPTNAAGAVGTETAEQKLARVEQENQSLRRYRADIEAEKSALAEREKVIEAKTRKGLTRAQAINVIERQKAFDEAQEKQWSERRPEIIKILRKFPDLLDARKQINHLFPGIVMLEEIKAAQKAMAAEPAVS